MTKKLMVVLFICALVGAIYAPTFQSAQAASVPLPEDYGVYSVENNSLRELNVFKQGDKSYTIYTQNKNPIFIVFEEDLYDVMLFKVPSLQEAEALAREILSDTNIKITIKKGPLNNNPHMLRIKTVHPLVPGIYALYIIHTMDCEVMIFKVK